MIINPVGQYSLRQLKEWFKEAQQKDEELIINPCNPKDVPFLHCSMTIRCRDDIAILTQWLGGIPE